MTWRVSVRADAVADLAEAEAWYEDQRAGLGNEFLASIADAFERLEQMPEQFPFYFLDFRRVLVDRFPFKIFFRIIGDAVVVFRILHATSEHRRRLRKL